MLVVGTNLRQGRILRLTELVPSAVLRARDVTMAPGGKPVNVARGEQAALVSGGRFGASLRTSVGSWWFTAPVVDRSNPVGAGDALVAGVATALERGEPLPAAVRFGVACAADSVRRIGPAAVHPDAVNSLLDQVRTTTSTETTP